MKKKLLNFISVPIIFLVSFKSISLFSVNYENVNNSSSYSYVSTSCGDLSKQKYVSNVYTNNYGQYDSKCITDLHGNNIIIEVLFTSYDSVYIHLGSDSNVFDGKINSFVLDEGNEVLYYSDEKMTNVIEPIDSSYDTWIYPWYYINTEGENVYRDSLYFYADTTQNNYPVSKDGLQYALPGTEHFSGSTTGNKYYTYKQEDAMPYNANVFVDDYFSVPYSSSDNTYLYYSGEGDQYYNYIYPQAWEEELSIESDSLKIFYKRVTKHVQPI